MRKSYKVLLVLIATPILAFLLALWLNSLPDIKESAIKQNNPSICSRMSDIELPGYNPREAKNVCRFDVAVKNKNPEACNYIDVKHTPNLEMRENCYIKAGAILNAENIKNYCSNIEEPRRQGECNGLLSAKIKNISVCNQLSHNEAKAYCYIYYARTANTLSANMCASLSGKYKDECLSIVAIRIKNSSLCESVESTYWKDYCQKQKLY